MYTNKKKEPDLYALYASDRDKVPNFCASFASNSDRVKREREGFG
jgi:hypothetical protein